MRTALYQLFVVLLVAWTLGVAGYVTYNLVDVSKTSATQEGRTALQDYRKLTGVEGDTFLNWVSYSIIFVSGFVWAIGVAALGVIALLLKPTPKMRIDHRREPRF